MRRMRSGGRERIVGAGGVLVGLVCLGGLAGLAACGLRPSAPESRAEYFVQKLVQSPEATDDLRAVTQLAAGEGPDSLVQDVPTRTALTYLRARARLGAKLGFHVAGASRSEPERRVVEVVASEALAVGADTVRFQVELQKLDGDWRVVHLHAD